MKKIIVTGGAGFIGSCMVSWLNSQGVRDIIIVDHWDNEGLKRKNIIGKQYSSFFDKNDFLSLILSGKAPADVDCVFHMGACSSTTGQDRGYYIKNNFEYSCHVARWAMGLGARFIYASSAATYGDGENGYADGLDSIRHCRPLNYYGESKQLFDEWVVGNGLYDRVVGLKFFNVFGPNEYHKGDMKSVIAKAYGRVVSDGKMMLFKSYRPDFSDGEQKRDFVYVKDVVDVMAFFMQNPSVNGIFNVGTGQARSWNDLAKALFAAVCIPTVIEYSAMPEILRAKYQYFTQADMSRLFKVGYPGSFTGLEAAIEDYVQYLKVQGTM
ncbi:MAG: ADP-glyceromanno-heptose 6-epimerase [Candidatus Omnitrophica bacterium]|nr:ADP-glyceromanno-heptose 6-epimerase [Candidatus Omnitrophota bacterium]